MNSKLNYFNNEERNGIFLLSSLLIVFSIFIFFQKRVLPGNATVKVSLTEVIVELDKNYANVNLAREVQQKSIYNASNTPSRTIKDDKIPTRNVMAVNSTSSHRKKSLAVSQIETSRVKDEKKAVFRKNAAKKDTVKRWKKIWKPKKIKAFSLNSQNPEDWKQIKGIGDGYSSRIIKYQKWLGGFHSVQQLNEVYGLTDSLVQVMKPHLTVTSEIKKIKINEADSKTLGRHPYVEWKEADIILRYRKHHFPINKESFLALEGVSEKTKEKILPYLDFQVKEQKESLTDEITVRL